MGLVTAIGLGVAAAGVAASAVVKKQAADKAAKIQKKAIGQQKDILRKKLDPETLNTLAQKADEERVKNRLALQKEVDPELAALRQQGKEQLLANASIPEESKQSTQLANALFAETKQQDPRLEAIKNSILDAAQTEINAGATLPPEFQAELVRAGLNTGSQAGIAIDKGTIGGGVARALGLAGIQLQQQRQQAAQQLATTGQNLVSARTNILASVFPKLRDLETVRRQEAAQNFGVGEATLPESGLSGQDVTNIEIARQKGLANAVGQQAQVKANQANSQGQFVSSLIGAGTSLAGGAAGAIGGGAGGALASNMVGVGGGGGAQVDIGQFGARTPAQQANFNYLQSLYA